MKYVGLMVLLIPILKKEAEPTILRFGKNLETGKKRAGWWGWGRSLQISK
jgi:hypothetical protein